MDEKLTPDADETFGPNTTAGAPLMQKNGRDRFAGADNESQGEFEMRDVDNRMPTPEGVCETNMCRVDRNLSSLHA